MTEKIRRTVMAQKEFFLSGRTQSVGFRKDCLDRLENTIRNFQNDICDALYSDLGKSSFESFSMEIMPVLEDIKLHRSKLSRWAAPVKAKIAAVNFPAKGMLMPEPYGVSLIFSAWNYPFNLAFSPLIGAVSAGCCAVVKPSEYAPATSEVTERIILTAFSPEHILAVQGDRETGKKLLNADFDHIFFTGSAETGRLVMHAAADRLIPVTLELGGKSPCVVNCDANVALAAKRIVWGKFLNAGQTCVAPDYVLAHRAVLPLLLEKMRDYIKDFYGSDPKLSPDYGRIVSRRQCERLVQMLQGATVFSGGDTDIEQKYIAPTLVTDVSKEHPLMRAEIFGPILPVLSFSEIDDAVDFINGYPKPLALYYFGGRHGRDVMLENTSSGGACVNDTVAHLANQSMPFGGVGASGCGTYHGKYSFDAFTHYKPVMIKAAWPDIPFRYPPFRDKLKYLKMLFK